MKMVKFSFFKEAMDVETEKAYLVKLGVVSNPIKCWLPKSKTTVYEDKERNGFNIVEIPLWLYLKTELPQFTDVFESYEV